MASIPKTILERPVYPLSAYIPAAARKIKMLPVTILKNLLTLPES